MLIRNLGTRGYASVSNQIRLGNGSASAPSATALGDTNTGIFFRTADTLSFTMGGTNSLEFRNGSVVLAPAAVLGWNTAASFGGTTDVQLSRGAADRLDLASGDNFRIVDGILYHGTTAGITASTTQTQGNGALTSSVNEVSTVANANDTVTLPTAAAGAIVRIFNNGANTLKIFPASGDNLGAGVDTSTTLAAGSNVSYVAYDATNWESV